MPKLCFLLVCFCFAFSVTLAAETKQESFLLNFLSGVQLPASDNFLQCVKTANPNFQFADDAVAELLKNQKGNTRAFEELGSFVTELGRLLDLCGNEDEKDLINQLYSLGQNMEEKIHQLFEEKEKFGVVVFEHKNGKGEASVELYQFALNWKDGKAAESATNFATLINDLLEL